MLLRCHSVLRHSATFDIDANGILNVSAKDMGTGKEQKIRIEASSGLSDEEIEKMVKDAEAHASEDAKVKDLADAKNNADTLIYSVEKTMNEAGDKISEDEKSKIKAASEALKAAMTSENLDEIKAKTEELQKASYKLAEEMYKQTQGQQPGADAGSNANAGAGSSKSNVEDADYEVVDDDDKK